MLNRGTRGDDHRVGSERVKSPIPFDQICRE